MLFRLRFIRVDEDARAMRHFALYTIRLEESIENCSWECDVGTARVPASEIRAAGISSRSKFPASDA